MKQAWLPAPAAQAQASAATTVLPDPTSPCSSRIAGRRERKIGEDRRERPLLRAGQSVAELRAHAVEPRGVSLERATVLRARPALAKAQEEELEHQQLFEREPAPRALRLLDRLGQVERAQRLPPVGHVERRGQRFGQRIIERRRKALERAVDERAEQFLRDPAVRRIDGDDAPSGQDRSIVPLLENLELGAREL